MSIIYKGFTAIPMHREHARVVCSWRYNPPYNIYGWLPWEQMEALGVEFGDPDLREEQYVSILNAENVLCGFAQLFPMEGVVRLGLGMRPDLCSQGLGKSFVEAIVSAAQQRNPQDVIDLEVLTWNERAIRVYEKSGFEITDTYEKLTPEGYQLFHCMVFQEQTPHQS